MMKKTSSSSSSTAAIAHGVGRRKSSVARVWLKHGTGKIEVNGKPLKDYFETDDNRTTSIFAFKVCGKEKAFDVQINVNGGGLMGQAGAVKLGVARALLETDETLKAVLKQNGLLTVDARLKERKKYGQKGARRKFQFVKR